jgi:acyl-CoA reductase-like NAD-dependent aldehyde dehydrogenase
MLGVFTASGQMCVAAERLYVFDAVYDELVRRVTDRVRKLRQGPPGEDPGGQLDVGAITMPRQLEIIQRQIDDAVGKGARVLTGGQRSRSLKGQFWEPTVVVDATHEMALVREETFGPVMTILRVRDEDEAVRLANDTAFGLGSSVFTTDPRRGERIASRISAGMTVVNDWGVAYLMQAAPFGGVRASGFGRINGPEGLRACCNVKTVVTDRLPIHRTVSLHPVRAATYPLLTGAVGLVYGGSLARRVRALGELARAAMKTIGR